MVCTKFYEIYKIWKRSIELRKRLDDFQKYTDYRQKYSDEINDPLIKREFMMETSKFLEDLLKDTRSGSSSILDNFNYEKKMEEMTLKWKEHIPELKQKFRQNQINKLI